MTETDVAVAAAAAAQTALGALKDPLAKLGTVGKKTEFDAQLVEFNTQLQVVFAKAGEASVAALKADSAAADDASVIANACLKKAQKAALDATALRERRRPTLS